MAFYALRAIPETLYLELLNNGSIPSTLKEADDEIDKNKESAIINEDKASNQQTNSVAQVGDGVHDSFPCTPNGLDEPYDANNIERNWIDFDSTLKFSSKNKSKNIAKKNKRKKHNGNYNNKNKKKKT